MYSQDRKYSRFRYRVIFVAFLLISPTASSTLKQDNAAVFPGIAECANILIAWIKDPDGYLTENPDKETIMQECRQSIWEMMKHAKSLDAGLVLVSGYLLYESNKLLNRAKSLELNLEKYNETFTLLEVKLYKITDFIDNDVKPRWNDSNPSKNVRNITEKVIQKLISFANELKELADNIHKDILQLHGDKIWSEQLTVYGAVACISSLFTVNPLVIVPSCSFGAMTIYWSFHSHNSLEETLKQSKRLKKDIKKMRKEITKTQSNLDVLTMRVDINM